jgi:hypothetical protein
MSILRWIIFAAISVLIASCGETNPFIGKWKSISQGLLCSFAGDLEITEKLFKSPLSQIGYTLERDGNGYVIDTHEPGKNKIIPTLGPDNTMTLNMGMGIECKYQRAK